MRKIYNKLVRDKIPEIIKREKRNPIIEVLSKEKFIIELFKKLLEESKELIKTKNNKTELIKEIGDVYEVIDAIINYYKINKKEVVSLKKERKTNRGGFNKRIFLKSIDD
ncbi:MAG: nucleoside triphosphate pyrophosphohydrolase [Patescibacteria group bacterium]